MVEITPITTIKEIKERKERLRKPNYYAIDISNMPNIINNLYKFMDLYPMFFSSNISKKIIRINDNQIYHIYDHPVIFKDHVHNIRGFINTEYDAVTKIFKIIINVRVNPNLTTTNDPGSICYTTLLETHINDLHKMGSVVKLHYNKILSDTIIKHCYYNKNADQWEHDVITLQNEFFLQNKDYLLSIMNNKTNNKKIGSFSNSWNNLILHGAPGTGKCLGLNTPVLMFDGTIKMIQDIKINELVMGDDSTPRTVLSLAHGIETMYEIVQDNTTYMVNRSHILSLIYHKKKRIIFSSEHQYYSVIWINDELKVKNTSFKSNDIAMEFYNNLSDEIFIDISVAEYLDLPTYIQHNLFGYKTSVEFSEQYTPIDAYAIGVWLGFISGTGIENYNYKNVLNTLVSLKLYKDDGIRYIPYAYKVNSRENRIKLLAGIIDSLATYDHERNEYIITRISCILGDDIVYVARSLGFDAFIYNGRVIIRGNSLHILPVVTPGKKAVLITTDNDDYGIVAHPILVFRRIPAKYYGFTLDQNHRFVLGNFIVTHNSSFVYRTSMTLKLNIVSIDLSLYLNKKKDLYALFHNQEFSLPNASATTAKEPALNNCIITLEEFDTSIEKLLDIENIFKYKDILKRSYLDLKNKEIKQKSNNYNPSYNDSDLNIEEVDNANANIAPKPVAENYEDFMSQMMLDDGYDTKNNKVMNKARDNLIEQRSHDNELNTINTELNNIIKSMDDDNKSNILRLSDLLELFQGPVPIESRIIIATTNNFAKIQKALPALFRSGRMTSVEFKYLDWITLNKLTVYYFNKVMTLPIFEIVIPTSQIVEMSIKTLLSKQPFIDFEIELQALCAAKK